MSLGGAFGLAWRYVSRHRLQSLLLACALGTVLALPLAVRVVVSAMELQMRARATATPLIAGPLGSSTDLMLTSLHFHRTKATLPVSACDAIRDTGYADAIPLYVRFHAQGAPIVGTELDYFDFRRLKLAEGTMLTRLGDCVLGAKVAAQKGLHAGGSIFSSPEQVFDIAGVYPLKMRIVGVFAPTGTPDDDAVFVDLKTAWLIQGIAHGHDDLAKASDASVVLSKEQGNVVGNAAVRMFAEVTDANVDGFHFHGDESQFPISAAIVLPQDVKSEALISGRYQGNKEVQMFRPIDVLERLLGALFKVERLIVAALFIVACAAFAVAVLVFWLSFKMREREFMTLAEVGVGRGTLFVVKVGEVLVISGTAILVAVAVRALAAAMAHAIFVKGFVG